MTFLLNVLLISNILNTILVFIICLLLIRQFFHSGFRITLMLALAFILVGLGWLTSIISNLFKYNPSIDEYTIFDWISLFLSSVGFGISFLAMILFFEYFSTIERNNIVYFVSSLFGALIMLFFTSLKFNDPNYLIDTLVYKDVIIHSWSDLSAILNFSCYLFFAIFSYDSLRKSKKHAINETQLKQIRIMFYGFSIIGVLVILGVVGAIAYFGFGLAEVYIWLVFVIQRILLSAGLFLVAYGYLSPGQVLYVTTQRLETLLIIHKTGIPLYRYDFDTIHSDADSSLVSGAITAISAIMSEAFKTTTNLKTINFHDKNLVLEFKNEVAFILITPKITPFILQSTKKVSDNFLQKYETTLTNGDIADVSVFSDSEDIILESFGFVE